jgi:hypothetical protein
MLQKHFDNNLDNNTLFGITHSGYLNTILNVEYIKHFDKITAKSVVKKYKILIFDSTGSYMLDQFTAIYLNTPQNILNYLIVTIFLFFY